MLQFYSENVSVAENGIVPILSVPVKRGSCATLVGSTVQLNAPGIYQILISCSVVPDATGTVGIQLLVNGLPLTQAYAEASGTAAETVNLSFPALIPNAGNACMPTMLSLRNTGGAITGDITGTVVKLCS